MQDYFLLLLLKNRACSKNSGFLLSKIPHFENSETISKVDAQ